MFICENLMQWFKLRLGMRKTSQKEPRKRGEDVFNLCRVFIKTYVENDSWKQISPLYRVYKYTFLRHVRF